MSVLSELIYRLKDLSNNRNSESAIPTAVNSLNRAVRGIVSGDVPLEAVTLKGLPQTAGAPEGYGDLAAAVNAGASSTKSIPDIFQTQIHYGALMGTGAVSGQTFVNGAFAASAPAAKGDLLIIISTASSGLVVGQLVSVLCDDGEYYSHLVTSSSGASIGIAPALRAPISAGLACISSFYKDQYHPSDYGYRAIADNILRRTLKNLEYCGSFYLNKNAASSTITVNSANTQANIGSSVVAAKDVTTSTVATQGVFYVTTIKEAGSYEASVQTKSDVAVKVYIAIDNIPTLEFDIPAGYCGQTTIPFVTKLQGQRVTMRVCAVGTAVTVTVNEKAEYYRVTNQSPSTLESFNFGRHCLIGDSWFAQLVFAARLAEKMPNATIVNKGVGGRKASDVLSAFDVDTAGDYDFIWLVCGTNDYVAAVTQDAFSSNIALIKNKVHQKGASLVFLGSSVGPAYSSAAEFNLSRQYAKLTEVSNQAQVQEYTISIPSITVAAGQTAYLAELGYFDPEFTLTGYYISGAGVTVRSKSTMNGSGTQLLAVSDNVVSTAKTVYNIGASKLVDVFANNVSGAPITYHGYISYTK